MTKDTVVAFRAPDGFSPDPLTDLLRQGARDLIAQAVEAELNTFLAAHADQIDAAGRRRFGPAWSSSRAGRSDRDRRSAGEGSARSGSGRRRNAVAVHVDDPAALSAARKVD